MKKRKVNFKKIVLFVLAMLSLAFLVVKAMNGITMARIKDNYDMIFIDISRDREAVVKDFKIQRQLEAVGTGPVTIAMMETQLGQAKTENDILRETGLRGRGYTLLPDEFATYLDQSLENKVVVLMNNIKDSEVIKLIYDQTSKGIPVPVYYTDFKLRGKYQSVYGIVRGINMLSRDVYLVNAEGFEEIINIDYFLDMLKLDKDNASPADIKMMISLGMIKKNNVYIVR